jgi:transposase
VERGGSPVGKQTLGSVPGSFGVAERVRAKTDRNDARRIAQMPVGLYRPVHVKTLRIQRLQMLLTHRKLPQSKAIAIEDDLRGTLRNFGLKVGTAGWTRFEARIEELVVGLGKHNGHLGTQSLQPLTYRNAALEQKGTVLIDHTGALAN